MTAILHWPHLAWTRAHWKHQSPLQVTQAFFFPLRTSNADAVSQPVNAWKTGRVRHFIGTIAATIMWMGMYVSKLWPNSKGNPQLLSSCLTEWCHSNNYHVSINSMHSHFLATLLHSICCMQKKACVSLFLWTWGKMNLLAPSTVMPKNWKDFLRIYENKMELFSFLSCEAVHFPIAEGKKF